MFNFNSVLGFLSSQWIILVGLVAVLLYYYTTYTFDYFAKRGVPFIKPLPLFGNMFEIIFRYDLLMDVIQKAYFDYSKSRFFGFFEFLKPVYYIRDPELIKQITIKDFEYFMDHRMEFDADLEPIFSSNLFAMKNPKWRHMRTTLSPAFTGSKMRQMFELIGECSKTVIESLLNDSKDITLEMKDFFSRIANDIIATSAFGIQTNSIKDRDNEFYEMGKEVTNFSGIQALKILGFGAFPKLMKYLRVTFMTAKTSQFFRHLVLSTIDYREKNKVTRPDMLNLLMLAKKEGSIQLESDTKLDDAGFSTVEESKALQGNTNAIKWSDDDLVGQCLVFFLAGFDTISSLMTFMSFELAVNPDIQERLRKEIDDVREELGSKPLTYEAVQKMKYLDMVVSESLRKWPSAVAIDRLCNKPYTMENSDGSKVHLKPGDGIWLPIHALLHDPEYYPNPEEFDPERFNDSNKGNINPMTYLPFGVGPRNCIGSRFALMEAKCLIFHILSTFTLERSPKTSIPLKLRNEVFNQVKAVEGIWLNLKAR